MRALRSQLRLDARTAYRGKFLHVTVGMALVFGLLIRFAVPAQIEGGGSELIQDAVGLKALNGAMTQLVSTEAELRGGLVENPDLVGVQFFGSVPTPRVRLLLQGHESEDLRGLSAATATRVWMEEGVTSRTGHVVELLGPQVPPAPLNETFLPLLYGLDTVILGFLFAGVMVLQEKAHGTVRFYRASPGSTSAYVASKVLVVTGIALVGAGVMTALVRPDALPNLRLLALLALATASLSLLGMGIAIFYDNLSRFFYPMAAAGIVLSLPMIRYGLPSAGLEWTRWIPTHGVMFGARELLLPAGRPELVTTSLGYLLAVFLTAAAAGTAIVHGRLMRRI